MARDLEGAAFGDQLRRERERRGVAVEAICASTKVPVRHIRSLEAGAFRDLPGGVFRRGFVRSYLGALGLEEASWMARFEESCRQSGVRDPADTNWVTFAETSKTAAMFPVADPAPDAPGSPS
jgi:cytoskeleton protein RodZ